MHAVEVIWDLKDDPDGNVQHIADHGLMRYAAAVGRRLTVSVADA